MKNTPKFTKYLLMSIPSRGIDDQVPLRWQDSPWTTSDVFGRPYFKFVVHISLFSFMKVTLDVVGLRQPR